jgi:hypothetical protein
MHQRLNLMLDPLINPFKQAGFGDAAFSFAVKLVHIRLRADLPDDEL